MRIVQVVSEYFPHETGGTQVHVRDLSRALRARGHEVEIFTAVRGGEYDEYTLARSEWEGVPVTTVTNNLTDWERFEMVYANPKLDARFAAFLWESRPDIVHFHHFTCLSTTLVEVCAQRGIPVVVTLHDYWLQCPRGQRLHPLTSEVCAELDRARCARCLHPLWPHLLPLEDAAELQDPGLVASPSLYALHRWEKHVQHMLALARTVIAPARFHRDRFVEWGLDPERCAVVPHGLDKRALLAEPRGQGPVKTIGYLGAVIPSKGVHVLIDAFNLLERPDLALAIHGRFQVYHEDSGYHERLVARVAPGLDVRFRGAYEPRELPAILAGIDVLVVPSLWWETFCLTLREGALAGIPVVAADIGGMHDAVEEGLALGFAPGDPADLARVLRRLIEDKGLRDDMSRKAHLVRDIADCAAETERLYTAALPAGARAT